MDIGQTPEMTLATRCSACGTIFRVVQDQLKVSDGWVRCGRCDTVFDALDGMIDPEAIGATSGIGAGEAGSHAASAPPHDAASVDFQQLLRQPDDGLDADDQAAIDRFAAIDEPTDDPAPDTEYDEPPDEVAPSTMADDYNRRADRVDLLADEPGDQPPATAPVEARPLPTPAPEPEPATATATAAVTSKPKAAMSASKSAPPVTPEFLLRAERKARWRNPAMRAALIGSSMILLLLLVLQVVVHRRDAIAAQSPLAAGWLESACARWGCRIEPPRSIRQVAIENSALAKLSGQAKAVKLSLTMRNRSSGELVMPAVELSLTDFEGKLIARRALMPKDFQVEPAVLAGGSELPLQLMVSAGNHRIAGYTVELFYP